MILENQTLEEKNTVQKKKQEKAQQQKARFAYIKEQLASELPRLVTEALKEDLGGSLDISKDLSAQLILENKIANAFILSREAGVFCGKAFADEVFKQLDAQLGAKMTNTTKITWHVKDGDKIKANTVLCHLEGHARILLTGERTAMNFIQTLSGCASKTALYVEKLRHTDTSLLDTRKTIPNLRYALKYAVACGGGMNHRIGVFDAYLIKENHIFACGGIDKAVSLAKALTPNKPIEIETENLDEVQQAILAGADIIMLDNFSLPMLEEAVALTQKKAHLEASGNVTLENLEAIAATGVDYISVGAITKHLTALDLSMRFQ